MLWEDIRPFSRYPRELEISRKYTFVEVLPPDARFFYIVRGEGTFRIDGAPVTLPEKSALFINAGVPYRMLPTGVSILAVNFDWTQENAAQNFPLHPIPVRELTADSDVPLPITFEDHPEFDRYTYREGAFFAEEPLRRLIRLYDRRKLHYQLESDAVLTLLLSEFLEKKERFAHGHFRRRRGCRLLAGALP